MLTLHVDGYFVSPLDACCMIALSEKGVEFTTSRALLRDGQGVPAELGARAMISRVPTLSHGDFSLTESLAIVEYLEDTFPAPAYPRLYPENPRARARARQLMAYMRFDLGTLREERPWWTCVYPAIPPLPPLSPRAAHEVEDLLAIAGRMVASGELGDWTIAHADLALTLVRLAHNGHPISAALIAFMETHLDRPSVRAYLHHPRPPNPPPRRAGGG